MQPNNTTAVLLSSIAILLEQGHESFRIIVGKMSVDELNRLPAADETNSVAQLISHALDAERFVISLASGSRIPRDREAQFHVTIASRNDLLALIDEVANDVTAALRRMTPERLTAIVEHGSLKEPGAWFVLHALEHTREHIGQALLTRQLVASAE